MLQLLLVCLRGGLVAKKKFSVVFTLLFNFFIVVSFTFLVHKLLFFLAKRDNFFPCVAFRGRPYKTPKFTEREGLKFGNILQTDRFEQDHSHFDPTNAQRILSASKIVNSIPKIILKKSKKLFKISSKKLLNL